MTEQPFALSWSNLTGGVNDNKYQAPVGRYSAGYNVDVRRYDITPSKDSTTVYTYADDVNAIFNTEVVDGTNNNILWIDDGTVYYNSTLRATLTNGPKGTRIGTMRVGGVDKLYYFQDTVPSTTTKYIHRSNVDGTGFEEGYFPGTKATYTSTTGNGAIVPLNGMQVISEGQRILFSHYNNIFEMSNTEVISALISFPSNENVIGITEFQGQYKVYTTIGFLGSKIYTWDGTSEAPELSIDMNGIAINAVVNDGAYDYATTYGDGSLYKIAGVQYQQLYKNIGYRVITNIKGLIYGQILKDNVYSIATYGSIPGYPTSLVPQYTINVADTTKEINLGAISYSSSNIYYGTKTLLKKLAGGGSTTFTSYIESLVFTGTNIEYEKTIKKIVLKFSGTTTTSYIRLEAQIQENGTWINLYECNNVTIGGVNHGMKITPSIFNNPVGNFNTIKFRISFVHNGSISGKFYGLDLYGDEDVGK